MPLTPAATLRVRGGVAGVLIAALAVCAGAACQDDGIGASTSGAVVFGVTSDLRAGVDVDRVDVAQSTNGDVTSSKTLSSSDAMPLAFPFEVRTPDLPGGTPVAVDLAAYLPGAAAAVAPVVTRSAQTLVKADHALLVRVRLEATCASVGQVRLPCAGGTTCIAGTCANPFVDPDSPIVSDYMPDWGTGMTDVCKPVLGETPQVIVGQGQSDYTPLADGDTVQLETGPQGGHHIWVALRTKNLNRSGTRTVLTAVQPDSGTKVPPFNVIFSFSPDEGGYCKLAMLRFQLDTGGLDYHQFLGKELVVTATVTDPSGDAGVGTRRVMVSATTI